MSWYFTLWADAFRAEDWFERLLARLSIICVHAALLMLAIIVIAATTRIAQ